MTAHPGSNATAAAAAVAAVAGMSSGGNAAGVGAILMSLSAAGVPNTALAVTPPQGARVSLVQAHSLIRGGDLPLMELFLKMYVTHSYRACIHRTTLACSGLRDSDYNTGAPLAHSYSAAHSPARPAIRSVHHRGCERDRAECSGSNGGVGGAHER